MEDLIATVEEKDYIYFQKFNIYQKIGNSYITNIFFVWVLLVLLINKKNWKRPVILILIFHWIFRSTGNAINHYSVFMPIVPNTYWPYSNKGWLMAQSIPNVFWLIGEIIGDWYPLLRTKAVVKNSKKIIYVYVTCIAYNLVKVYAIYALFADLPIDFSYKDEYGNNNRDIVRIKIRYWSTTLAIQITSFMYDLSVILTLKNSLFNKLKEYQSFSSNTFLSKFKQISELRIVFSMTASMIFLPFIIAFVVYLVNIYKMEGVGSIVPSDQPVDCIRSAVLNINYTLMYIDQILLQIIVERNRNTVNFSNTKNQATVNTSSSNLYINKGSQGSMEVTPTTQKALNSSVILNLDNTTMSQDLSENKGDQINKPSPTYSSSYYTLYNESMSRDRNINSSYSKNSEYTSYNDSYTSIRSHGTANENSLYYFNNIKHIESGSPPANFNSETIPIINRNNYKY